MDGSPGRSRRGRKAITESRVNVVPMVRPAGLGTQHGLPLVEKFGTVNAQLLEVAFVTQAGDPDYPEAFHIYVYGESEE